MSAMAYTETLEELADYYAPANYSKHLYQDE